MTSERADACPRAGALVELRESVLRQHLPLVRDVARAMVAHKPPQIDFDELVSWGMEGLLDAYRRYQPERATSFRTYARFRVRGIILDNLRERDALTRTARTKASRLDRARARLESSLGRPATEEELAAALEVDLATLRAIRLQAAVATVSIEDLGARERGRLDAVERTPDAPSDPLGQILGEERRRMVAAAIRRLPAKEHAAVALYYRNDLTMREVAHVLGLSESRVSQLHSQALARLRTLLRQDITAD